MYASLANVLALEELMWLQSPINKTCLSSIRLWDNVRDSFGILHFVSVVFGDAVASNDRARGRYSVLAIGQLAMVSIFCIAKTDLYDPGLTSLAKMKSWGEIDPLTNLLHCCSQ